MEVLADEMEDLSLKAARQRHQQDQQRTEQEIQLDLMMGLLGDTPQPCRSLLQGHHLLGLSCAELAEKGRVPIGTVMGRLARCREALKQRLVKALEGGKA